MLVRDVKMKQAFLLFHVNIMFSSISEEQYGIVIEKCYWPMLKLCEKHDIAINIELSKISYDIIQKLDPSWIAKLHYLESHNRS